MKTATKSKGVDKAKSDAAAISEVIKLISLEDLLPNPYQPATRAEVDPETAKRFAMSIQEHGLIQTPVVRAGKEDGKYEIGDGWLRRAGFAYLASNITASPYRQMPCVVRQLTDQQMADMVLEANTVRKDLNPIELARLYKQYLEDFKIPQVELARRHNCSQGEIANTIRLLELPADIQGKIISQEISETHGRQFLRLNHNPDLQQKELRDCIKEGSSVNQLSNSIAQTIYYESVNIDPEEYPKPLFDITDCEKCPNRQKIGMPYSNDKKRWRCLDKACFEKKAEKAKEERIAKLTAEIQAAREAAPAQEGETKGKKKGKKAEVGVVDTKSFTWRDYQELDREYQSIDDPAQCKTCASRAVGLFHGGRTGPICVNVKCFKEKEKKYQSPEAAKTRKAEQEKTDKLKSLCDQPLDQLRVLKMIAAHLVLHSRRDTLEKFGKLYQIDDAFAYFNASSNGDTLQKLAALVLQKERYEGEKGMFVKMMADLEGTGGEVDKQIKEFQKKHCSTCQYNEVSMCWTLMRTFLEPRCYRYTKKEKKDKAVDENPDGAEKSSTESDQLQGSLPCKTCANAETCQRTFFYANEDGGLSCDQKIKEEANV
jgi:ParB family chromosome partitioning protein